MRSLLIIILCIVPFASCKSQVKPPEGIQVLPAKQIVIRSGMKREEVYELLGYPTLRLMGNNGGRRWVYLDADCDAARFQGLKDAWVIFPSHGNQTIVVAFKNDDTVEYVSTR